MYKRKIITIILIIAVIFIASYFFFFAGNWSASGDGFPKDAVWADIKQARLETITNKISQNGTVEIVDKTTIYPSTQAEIKSLNIKVGDIVTEGQVIATYSEKTLENLQDQLKDANLNLLSAQLGLENVILPASETEILQAESSVKQNEKNIFDINAQIDQSDISIQTLERNLQTAKENYDKSKVFFEKGITTKNELDNVYDTMTKIEEQLKTAASQRDTLYKSLETAQSSLQLSKKQYEAILNRTSDKKVVTQSNLQKVQIDQANRNIERIQKQINDFKKQETADASGTVLYVGYNEGETAVVSKQMCVIADLSNKNMVITVFIPENDAGDIVKGQKVDIKGGALGDKVYIGTISKIYPLAEKKQIGNSMETVITVEISIDDPNAVIKPGYTVETEIITKVSENAVVVPLMATQLDKDDSYYVYIVNADNKAEKRAVKLLTYSNLNVEVEGVEYGERVIENPSPAIKDGSYVRQIDENNPNYKKSK